MPGFADIHECCCRTGWTSECSFLRLLQLLLRKLGYSYSCSAMKFAGLTGPDVLQVCKQLSGEGEAAPQTLIVFLLSYQLAAAFAS